MTARLRASLEANTSNFENGMRRARASATTFGSEMNRVASTVKTAFVSMAAYMSVGALAQNFKEVVNQMEDIGKAARRMNVSTESMSRLAYAGRLAEVDIGALEKAYVKMEKAIYAADGTLKTNITNFDRMGISLGELKKLSPENQFVRVATAIKNIPDTAKRAAMAVATFGKEGLKIVDFAGQGADAMHKLFAESDKYGMTFMKPQTEAAEKFNDSIRKVKSSFTGLFGAGASEEKLTTLTSAMESLADNMGNLAKGATLLASVFAGRLISSVVSFTAGIIPALIATRNFSVAAVAVTGTGKAASLAMVGMARAGKLLSTAFAFMGGWVGLLATAASAVYLFGDDMLKAADSATIFGVNVGKAFRVIVQASKDLYDAIGNGITNTFTGFRFVIEGEMAKIKMLYIDTMNFVADSWIGKKLKMEEIIPDPDTALLAGKTIGENFAEGVAFAKWGRSFIDNIPHITITKNEIKKVQTATGELSREWEKFRQGSRDALSSFVSDLVRGEGALGSFRNMAINVLNDILTSIVSGNASSGIGGSIAKFAVGGLGKLFNIDTTGIFNAEPVASKAVGSSYVMHDSMTRVHKGESILRADETSAIQKAQTGGVTYNIDARGAQAGVEQKIAQVIRDMNNLKNNVPRIAVNSMRMASMRGAA